MSLINQMLKDLERRARSTIIPSELNLLGLQTSPFAKLQISYFYWLCMLGFVSLLFAIVFFFKVTTHKQLHSELMQNAYTIKVQPLDQVADSSMAAPTLANIPADNLFDIHTVPSVITGLAMQVQKDMTHLRLLLSQDTFYWVSNHANQQIMIQLDHARLLTSLPSINTVNSAIQNLKILNQKNGDVLIILTLKKDAELTHLALNNEGRFPEFQIDMTYKSDLNEPEVKSQTTMNNIPEPSNTPEPTGALKKFMLSMSPEEEYQQAVAYSNQRQYEKAVPLLSRLIDKFPNYTAARELLIKLLLNQNNISKANELISIGLQKQPNYSPFIEFKAHLLVNAGKVSDALNLLQQAPPAIDKNPEYHAFIAALYQRQGQSMLAAKLYEQLLPLEPENAVWWMGLGIAYEDLGRHNDAVQAYLRAENGDRLSPELKAYIENRMHSIQ